MKKKNLLRRKVVIAWILTVIMLVMSVSASFGEWMGNGDLPDDWEQIQITVTAADQESANVRSFIAVPIPEISGGFWVFIPQEYIKTPLQLYVQYPGYASSPESGFLPSDFTDAGETLNMDTAVPIHLEPVENKEKEPVIIYLCISSVTDQPVLPYFEEAEITDEPFQEPEQFPAEPEEEPEEFPAVPEEEPEEFPAEPEEEPEEFPAVPEEEPEEFPAVPEEEPEEFPAVPEEEPEQFPAVPEEEPEQFPAEPEEEPEQFPAGPEEEQKTIVVPETPVPTMIPQQTPIPQGMMINLLGRTKSSVNFRKEMSRKAKKIDGLKAGEYIYLLREELDKEGASWTAILYKNQFGYVMTEYIEQLPDWESGLIMPEIYKTPVPPMTEEELWTLENPGQSSTTMEPEEENTQTEEPEITGESFQKPEEYTEETEAEPEDFPEVPEEEPEEFTEEPEESEEYSQEPYEEPEVPETPVPTMIPQQSPVPQGMMINLLGRTKSRVNFRKEMSKKAKLIAELKSGEYIYLLREELDQAGVSWTAILYKNQFGYVMTDYIEQLPDWESDLIMPELYTTPVPPMTEEELWTLENPGQSTKAAEPEEENEKAEEPEIQEQLHEEETDEKDDEEKDQEDKAEPEKTEFDLTVSDTPAPKEEELSVIQPESEVSSSPAPVETDIPMGEMINRFAVTNAKNVRFRADKTTDSKIISEISKGSYVYLIREELNQKNEAWTMAMIDGQTGYIMSKFLAVLSQAESDDVMQRECETPVPFILPEMIDQQQETPVITEEPTATPTEEPSATPTEEPTGTPTAEPTATPTAEPTATPTAEPTATPTAVPTATPTVEPTATPTAEPTATPTAEPTATPTAEPTATPTAEPTAPPTTEPVPTPTDTPPAKHSGDEKPTAKPTNELLEEEFDPFEEEDLSEEDGDEDQDEGISEWVEKEKTTINPPSSSTEEPPQITGFGVTIGDGAYVRSWPSYESVIVDELPGNKVVYVNGQVYENQTAWHQIQYDEELGYVRADMLRMMTQKEIREYLSEGRTTPAPTEQITIPPYNTESLSSYGYVTSGPVNFRKGAGKSAERIGQLKQYAMCLVLGTDETSGQTWYRVSYNGKTGYISGDFFKQMTISEFQEFLGSENYYKGLEDPKSRPTGGVNTTEQPVSTGQYPSAEDEKVQRWINPESETSVSYAPFNPFATPEPVNETETGNEYLDSLINDLQKGTITENDLETKLRIHYKDAIDQDQKVMDGLAYIREKAGLNATETPSATPEIKPLETVVPPQESSGSGNAFIWIFIILLLALTAGGLYWYKKKAEEKKSFANRQKQKTGTASVRTRNTSVPAKKDSSVAGASGSSKPGGYFESNRRNTSPQKQEEPIKGVQPVKPYSRNVENPYARYTTSGSSDKIDQNSAYRPAPSRKPMNESKTAAEENEPVFTASYRDENDTGTNQNIQNTRRRSRSSRYNTDSDDLNQE